MKNIPLVSVIMPTYNSTFVRYSVESVLRQTYQNWELLITDDCSKDTTWSLLNELTLIDERIKVFKLSENKGAGPARNNSIKKAKGKYIAFLDSDDLWLENKLEVQIKFMEDGNLFLTHSSYDFINEKGNKIKKPFIVRDEPIDYISLLKKNEIGCLTAVYNKEKLGKVFMPDIRRKQDYALWLSILKKRHLSYPITEVLALYRVSKNQVTGNKLKLIPKHFVFLKKSQNFGYLKSLFYTFLWGYHGLIKHYLFKIKIE
ncbi:glycosyltransferase family 2 protein [uncultured Polaribacter sp.]|uniref:glycosyltransferase family 2 protein n=1 Tax=uncultured Polaribacter sp. TaxID=174711 RepID=UPI00259B4840|nr:glycosyltransferase family 2 protein [uncultured Polaribacter sp.]